LVDSVARGAAESLRLLLLLIKLRLTFVFIAVLNVTLAPVPELRAGSFDVCI
jgi:hypothetical protein